MLNGSVRTSLIGAVAVAFALPVLADDVFLENGRTFESVIVVAETDDTVKIRLAYGEMSLPRSWVKRVVQERTPLDEFLHRQRLLIRKLDAGVTDWLELAVWARANELEHGYRESVLAAAEIDPGSESLPVHMRRLDMVFDKKLDRWIGYEESQRRAGLVRSGGSWVPKEEVERDRRSKQQAGPTTEERLGNALEALAVATLERERRETEERRSRSFRREPPPVFHVRHHRAVRFPVVRFVRLPRATDEKETEDGKKNRGTYDSLRRRQPGSLLVSRPGARHTSAHTRIRRQPGSLALRP